MPPHSFALAEGAPAPCLPRCVRNSIFGNVSDGLPTSVRTFGRTASYTPADRSPLQGPIRPPIPNPGVTLERCGDGSPERVVRPVQDRTRARGRRDGDRVSRPRPPPRSQGRAQGAASRTRRRHRRRSVPERDQDHRQSAAPAHPGPVRLRRGGRVRVLRDAVRGGGVAPRPAQPREAARRGRRAADRRRGGRRAGIRARPRHHPPRHQARKRAAARGACAGGGLRHRAGGEPRRRRHADDRNGDVARHPHVHEPRAGDGGARDLGAERRVRVGGDALRDAGGRSAVHGEHGAGDRRQGADGGAGVDHGAAAHRSSARGGGGAQGAREAAGRPVRKRGAVLGGAGGRVRRCVRDIRHTAHAVHEVAARNRPARGGSAGARGTRRRCGGVRSHAQRACRRARHDAHDAGIPIRRAAGVRERSTRPCSPCAATAAACSTPARG